MGKLIDLTGQTFGRLTVVRFSYVKLVNGGPSTKPYWLCECTCGNRKEVQGQHLRTGATVSCGCLQDENRLIHGQHGTPEYKAWQVMMQRCYNSKHPGYKYWGGRGIKVADCWHDVLVFLRDVGKKTSSRHSLDRIDNDKDYEPGNVRWATAKEQANNRRVTPSEKRL